MFVLPTLRLMLPPRSPLRHSTRLRLLSRFGIRRCVCMCVCVCVREASEVAINATDRPHHGRNASALSVLCRYQPAACPANPANAMATLLPLHNLDQRSLRRFGYARVGDLTGHVSFLSLLHRAIFIILVLFAMKFIFTDSFLCLDKP